MSMEEKIDDVLPGFRFHPTDEELVGFYLKRKIQQRSLPIELIKQVDIYKYDPWDLPKLSPTGEKEWYFYCPRDRKYRNSARPNRVTGAGFWKATGTDRPIYSSDGSKCIGLKKSLVFYRGRAAKGIKTDWMMHEFRLPTLADQSSAPTKLLDKTLPPNDGWAICRIFKKTNSMAQRALSHSWVSPLPDIMASDHNHILNQGATFSSENMSSTEEVAVHYQMTSNIDDIQQASTSSFSALDHVASYKPINIPTLSKPPVFPVSNCHFLPMFSPALEISGSSTKSTLDYDPSMVFSSTFNGDSYKASESTNNFDGPQPQQQLSTSGLSSFSLPQNLQSVMGTEEGEGGLRKMIPNVTNDNSQWGTFRSIGFPFSLPADLPDAWKSNLQWDSPPCHSEMSTTYSPDKSYA